MPRRRALTEAELGALVALPTDDAVLVRHWTLSEDDLAAIVRRRRDRNQLGFAFSSARCDIRGGCRGQAN